MNLQNALSSLPPPWIVLAEPCFGEDERKPAADYLVLHPERGALLIDTADPVETRNPLAAFIAFLRAGTFHEDHPGRFPVFRWTPGPEDPIPAETDALAAFLLRIMSSDAKPEMEDPGWAASLAALLIAASPFETDPSFGPLPFPSSSFRRHPGAEGGEVADRTRDNEPRFTVLAAAQKPLQPARKPRPIGPPLEGAPYPARHRRARHLLSILAGAASVVLAFWPRPIPEPPFRPAPIPIPEPVSAAPAPLATEAAAAPLQAASPGEPPPSAPSNPVAEPPRAAEAAKDHRPRPLHRRPPSHPVAAFRSPRESGPPHDAADLPAAEEACHVYSLAGREDGTPLTRLACRLGDGTWQTIMEGKQ